MRAVADEIDVRYPDDKKSADDEIAKRIVDMLGWDVEIPPAQSRPSCVMAGSR